MPPRGRAWERPRQTIPRKIRELTLDAQNPGRGRNLTALDSQTYSAPVTSQMSGAWGLGYETSENRLVGYGQAGT